jgi:dienelactone hydrolase
VTIAPDYPSFGEHAYDFSQERGYSSGSMKAIWDNIRSIDLLEAMPEVDSRRIGCIGHSLGGHNAIFTAVFEPRLRVIVSSCGFTSLAEDDIPSWTGPRYMPRIASDFNNEVSRVPFDFHELIASLAPRPFLACVAENDDDFSASGVRDVMKVAGDVYRLYDAERVLQSVTAPVPHSFPLSSREQAYAFLRDHLAESGN